MYFLAVLYCSFLCLTWREAIGYRFSCLETARGQCTCDTEDELIDCHGKNLRSFPEISHRLRGFSILSLFDNRIRSPLPDETMLLRLLPNLQLIDLENNPHLNCSELIGRYETVRIISYCLASGGRNFRTTTESTGNGNFGVADNDSAEIPPDEEADKKLCRFFCELERDASRKGDICP